MGAVDLPFKECYHCGQWHSGACLRIKSIEYYPNGTIKKVEYHGEDTPNYQQPQPSETPLYGPYSC